MLIEWYFSEILDCIGVIEVEGVCVIVDHIEGNEVRMREDERVIDHQRQHVASHKRWPQLLPSLQPNSQYLVPLLDEERFGREAGSGSVEVDALRREIAPRTGGSVEVEHVRTLLLAQVIDPHFLAKGHHQVEIGVVEL